MAIHEQGAMCRYKFPSHSAHLGKDGIGTFNLSEGKPMGFHTSLIRPAISARVGWGGEFLTGHY